MQKSNNTKGLRYIPDFVKVETDRKKLGRYSTGGISQNTTYQDKRLNVLEEKIKDLEAETDKATSKVKDIENSLSKSEKRITQTTNFLMFVAGVVMLTFFFASIPILYDYYKDNYEQYEKYLKDVNELKTRMEILERRNDLIWENQIKNNSKP